ncbi:MAG: single-stranded DNA-binding protein [Clostridia bacterium]|nr:single-stranded DNA-binding protein [Clostridia bacterium]
MASLNLNKVVLAGRITADPELKTTQNGISVTTFSLAVNRRYSKDREQQADFISIVAWRNTAEFITKYFKKGSAICITGSIQTRTWTDNQGNKRYATEVVADEAMFVDSKSDSAPSQAYAEPEPAFSSNPETAPKFEEISGDDDLPF